MLRACSGPVSRTTKALEVLLSGLRQRLLEHQAQLLLRVANAIRIGRVHDLGALLCEARRQKTHGERQAAAAFTVGMLVQRKHTECVCEWGALCSRGVSGCNPAEELSSREV